MAVSFFIEKAALSYGLFSLGKEPAPGPNEQFLYINSANNHYQVIRYNQQMTVAGIKSNKFDTRYTISTNVYDYEHESSYMSDQIKYPFIVSIIFQISIYDPFKYVLNQNFDIEMMLKTKFKRSFDSFCRSYDVLNYNDARVEFQDCINKLNIPEELSQYGLKVDNLFAELKLSDAAEEYYQYVVDSIKEKSIKAKIEIDTEKIDINTKHSINEEIKRVEDLEQDREKERNNRKIINAMEDFRRNQLEFGPETAIGILAANEPDYYKLLLSVSHDRRQLIELNKTVGLTTEQATEMSQFFFTRDTLQKNNEQSRKEDAVDIFEIAASSKDEV